MLEDSRRRSRGSGVQRLSRDYEAKVFERLVELAVGLSLQGTYQAGRGVAGIACNDVLGELHGPIRRPPPETPAARAR